jgi:hypothetical protein
VLSAQCPVLSAQCPARRCLGCDLVYNFSTLQLRVGLYTAYAVPSTRPSTPAQ